MSLTVPPATEFPVLAQEGLVYLDSAATSQTPRSVIEAMDRYYNEYRASIHRGVYPLAAEATEAYEVAREKVAAFTGSTAGETVFTKNGTEAINLVAYTWGRANSARRHRGAHADGAPLEHRAVAAAGLPDSSGCRSPTTACSTWTRSTRRSPAGPKLVAVTHVSNVLGTVNPIAEIARRAHEAGALVVVDGMQAVAAHAGRRRASSTSTSTPGPATRPTGRPASACCTAAASCSRRCRRSSAAGT